MQGVSTRNDQYWTWIHKTTDSRQEALEFDRIHAQITGKYLFFSVNRERLIALATKEILDHGFLLAKVPLLGKNIGEEYVLCLYFTDDSRKEELAQRYGQDKEIRYRYWKSDADTRAAKYSKEFLDEFAKTGMNLDEFKAL